MICTELEWFHGLRAPPGAWMVIRTDGRSFSGLTEREFTKPFDDRFHAAMLATAERLLVELAGLLAYTESDEISVLLHPGSELFNRAVEKLDSISAGIASSAFSLRANLEVHFDSRLWLGITRSQVIDYFRWRQADATRCCLNGWCYWMLRQSGRTVQQATHALEGLGFSEKNELLFSLGQNFASTPSWQRLGSMLYWGQAEKQGHNPKTGEAVLTTRRTIVVNEDLPRGDGYASFMEAFLGEALNA